MNFRGIGIHWLSTKLFIYAGLMCLDMCWPPIYLFLITNVLILWITAGQMCLDMCWPPTSLFLITNVLILWITAGLMCLDMCWPPTSLFLIMPRLQYTAIR